MLFIHYLTDFKQGGKWGLEIFRPTTPPVEKGGKWGLEI